LPRSPEIWVHENRKAPILFEWILDSKLEARSPLYYGKLPYVINGCCAGRQFSMAQALSKWQGNCS